MRRLLFLLILFPWNLHAMVMNTPSQAGNIADPITGQMICYIPFNDAGGGTAVDITTGAHLGTFSNVSAWISGVSGSGHNFVAANTANLSLANPSTLAINRNAFTITFWLKHTQATASGYMAYSETNPTNLNPRIFIDYNDSVAGDIGMGLLDDAGGDVSFWTGNVGLSDGDWHLCAFVQYNSNPGKRDIFTDGIFRASASGVLGTVTVTEANIGVLHNSAFNNYMTGNIDQFRIWNVALTTSQIKAIYTARK